MHRTHTILISLFLVNLRNAFSQNSQCNSCSPTGNFRCTTPNTYQFCDFQGNPVGIEYTCPVNLLCSTSTATICSAAITGFTPDCTCGICRSLPTNNIACVSNTQYSFCTGTSIFPNTEIFRCPSGMVCSENTPSPCAMSSTNQVTNSCSSNSAINENCTSAGTFPVANSQCKNYYVCIFINVAFVKYTYTCPGNTTFSSITRKCGLYGCN